MKTFKKRYNVDLYNFVYVLKDLNESDDYNTPDCLVHKWGIVPKDDVTKNGRYVGQVNLNKDTLYVIDSSYHYHIFQSISQSTYYPYHS